MHTFSHIQARNVTVSVNVYLKGSAENTNDTENYKSCDTDTSASLSINGSSCSIETQELHNLNLDYDNSYQNDHHESSSSSGVTGKATFGCDAEANKEIHTGNQAPALEQLQWHFDGNCRGSEKLSSYLTTNNTTQHGSEAYEYSFSNKPVAAQGVTNGVISNSHKSKELDLLEVSHNHLPSSISSTTELTDDEASSTSTVSRGMHSPSDLELDAQSDISQVPQRPHVLLKKTIQVVVASLHLPDLVAEI
ncbi:hypothetical protein EB796_016797 [Bugula neritina]|uniref:Uncharacterized protein n=1 Tax=Bugula neritina TaxID=10212 RepID=A0A7J7JFR8_BUGNE|nr:hypothetical protein EB796_016797 [Bugula neritina]